MTCRARHTGEPEPHTEEIIDTGRFVVFRQGWRNVPYKVYAYGDPGYCAAFRTRDDAIDWAWDMHERAEVDEGLRRRKGLPIR